jgi:hypothetical protein
MVWTDRNLIWTPASYGLIAKTTFPSDTIWKPPLIIGNSATAFKMIGMKDSYIKVVNTGLVLWQPGESIIFTCSIDSTYFPFDTQICKFSLLVWGFDIDEVELKTRTNNENLHICVSKGKYVLSIEHVNMILSPGCHSTSPVFTTFTYESFIPIILKVVAEFPIINGGFQIVSDGKVVLAINP